MKKFRSKKSKRKISIYKIVFLVVLTFFFYYLFTQVFFNFKLADSNQEFLQYMLNDSNHHLKYTKKNKTINDLLELVLQIDITQPISLLKSTFKMDPEKVEATTSIINEEFTDDESEINSEYVYDPNPTTINNPKIYIYNTHQLESYNSSDYTDYNITPNVLIASYLLKEKLNKSNIKTVVETSNITEFLNLNNWDYSKSYDASRYFIKQAIDSYPDLKLLIDLHRDSISKDKSTVTIGDKKYAKILFVVGEEHDNYQQNLSVAQTLNDLIKNKYPTLTRGIITKSGSNVNGIYNQDLSTKSILIELGGNENTMDEVINTINVLAEVLKNYIGE